MISVYLGIAASVWQLPHFTPIITTGTHDDVGLTHFFAEDKHTEKNEGVNGNKRSMTFYQWLKKANWTIRTSFVITPDTWYHLLNSSSSPWPDDITRCRLSYYFLLQHLTVNYHLLSLVIASTFLTFNCVKLLQAVTL